MIAEYRLIITATFNVGTDRDAAYNAMKTQIQTYATNNPGKLKRADMTKDDYVVPDNASATEKVV
jgi:hypothetical protein